jgi:hypothetical protein
LIVRPHDRKIYETALLDCWIGDDGIMYSISKVAERTISNYDEVFAVYNQLSNGGKKKLRIIGDISKTQPSDKSVRDYISAELPKYVGAMALVSATPMGKEIGNLFKILSSSPYPVRVYDSFDHALNWLKDEFKLV